MAYYERFSLPRNDTALVASLRGIIEGLKNDIPRLERRVVNIRVFMERIIGEGWSMGYNPKRKDSGRQETEQNDYSMHAPRSRRLWQNWMDCVEEDGEDVLVGRTMEGWNGVPPGVDLSSYTYRDDADAHDVSSFSNSFDDRTDSTSDSREPLMSGANGASPSSSRSCIANDVHNEGDTASLHRKKDSRSAEFVSGAKGDGSRADTGEDEEETGRSKLRRSFSNVMNRGRPHKQRTETRKVSGTQIR